MDIRKLSPYEHRLHRELRLRALAEDPDSFGETYEAVTLLSDLEWERRTAHVTDNGSGVMFIASTHETSCGCAYGLIDAHRPGAGRVGGMWVDPLHRRSGVGSALLKAVLGWTDELGLSPIRLWAPAHEHAARALYARAGFRETGQMRPLPTNPDRSIVEMELIADI